MQAITVSWQDAHGRERKFYISLNNFPASEVQRMLDEIGKRRPDLKIPTVGKQETAFDGVRHRKKRKS
jgi:hypothetical protein